MANPRKFAEKIALHTQKQEEETRAFEQIMKEVTMLESSIKAQHHQQLQPHYRGGSLPNVNLSLTHAQNHIDLQNALNSLDDLKVRHNLADRMPMRHTRFQGSRPVPVNTNKRFGGIDTSPYHTGCHLSPPQHLEQGWRRTASDSAIHASVMHSDVKPKEINVNKLPSNSFETRTIHGPQSRPKSCEVPGIKIYPSSEQASTGPTLPISSNTGSLPDLTNLHIPSPLQTPIDIDEQGNQAMSPTQQFPMSLTRQGLPRRQPVNQQPLRKSPYSHQIPMMDANISPLENRLQQFQLYPQMNSQGNSDFNKHTTMPVTTGASPTLSPTSSSPLTPFFSNFPPSSMSDFYFKQQPPQQQQPSTFALQQQFENFSMHHPVGGMINSTGQLPFQSLLAQSPSSFPQSMAGLAHLYSSHSRVPDLVVTGIDDDGPKSDFAKDLSMAMAHVGEDGGEMYGSDDPLKVVLDPLDVEGIQMLSGQEPELTDAATEDTFRMDRLGTWYNSNSTK